MTRFDYAAGGSHSSMGLPSGSWTRAKRPVAGSSHSSFVITSSPASRNGTSTVSRRSEEHTSELQSLMRNSYAVLRLKKKTSTKRQQSDMTVVAAGDTKAQHPLITAV